MRKLVSMILALSMLLSVVAIPAMAETTETDWSKKDKIKITWTTYYTAPPAEDAVIIKKIEDGVKIMGNGELTKKLTVQANKFTATAKEKIEAAGGKAEVI